MRRYKFRLPFGLVMVREANTLSEARALAKTTLGMDRLPVGIKETDITNEPIKRQRRQQP